ncbi:MAG: hypothetical protein ABIH59_03025 [archaeon]
MVYRKKYTKKKQGLGGGGVGAFRKAFGKAAGAGVGAGFQLAGYGVKAAGKGVAWGGKAAWKNAHSRQLQAQQQQAQQAAQQQQQTQQATQQQQAQQIKQEQNQTQKAQKDEKILRIEYKKAQKIFPIIENAKTIEEIKNAQNTIKRKLLPFFHPDKHPLNPQLATQLFQDINNWQGLLTNKTQEVKQIEYKQKTTQNNLKQIEKTAKNKTIAADRAAAAYKNAEARFIQAKQRNQGVHSAERSYKRMYTKLKKAEDEYQKAQLDLVKARKNI